MLIYFWASSCRACEAEIDEIQQLYENYGERGLEVIGVSVDLNRNNMHEFLENHPITFLNFQDLDVVNVNTWEPKGMSAIYLVNQDATVTFVHTGSDLERYADPDFLALEQMVKKSLFVDRPLQDRKKEHRLPE